MQQSRSLYGPIKRNNLRVSDDPVSNVASKTKQQLSSARNHCLLFPRLYISCQTREGNLDEFFQHENQSCPPSLSQDGKLRLPQKTSELAELFQSFTTPQVKMPEEINAIIIDGSVVVNMIKPATGTERHLQNIQDSPFYPTFTLSSLMQSALMLYGMNILKTVLRPLPEVN